MRKHYIRMPPVFLANAAAPPLQILAGGTIGPNWK